jgi:hypothetical protein
MASHGSLLIVSMSRVRNGTLCWDNFKFVWNNVSMSIHFQQQYSMKYTHKSGISNEYLASTLRYVVHVQCTPVSEDLVQNEK